MAGKRRPDRWNDANPAATKLALAPGQAPPVRVRVRVRPPWPRVVDFNDQERKIMPITGASPGATASNYDPISRAPAPPPRPSVAKAAQAMPTAGLMDTAARNRLDHRTQGVILAEDLDSAHREQRPLAPNVIAWNTSHVFMQHPAGKPVCIPNYRGATSHSGVMTDDATPIPLPELGAIRASDPSHRDYAFHVHAEFRLNKENRMMGYCVNGKLISSLLQDRGLYRLDTGDQQTIKWMCCKNVRGKEFAPYAAMLLFEGKRDEEIAGIANELIEQAEARVSNDPTQLIDFLEREGGAWKPASIGLRDKTRGEAIRLIAKLLDNQGTVMLVTGDRARLIDAVGINEQGEITFTFRDAYTGTQCAVTDHDNFWCATRLLPRIFDEFYSPMPQNPNGRDSHNFPQFTAADRLICMIPRTPSAAKPKPTPTDMRV